MPSSRSLAIVEAIVRGDATFESIPVELWRRQYREHALAEAQRTEVDLCLYGCPLLTPRCARGLHRDCRPR